MTYAAYLRIYEPVAAFHEPDRSRWASSAVSAARPRRRDSLSVEHAEALRRAIATPQVAVPDQESEHAYVRRADGAAADGVAKGEGEFAVAMYKRVQARWQTFAEFEMAN
jgi:hypothetical protein